MLKLLPKKLEINIFTVYCLCCGSGSIWLSWIRIRSTVLFLYVLQCWTVRINSVPKKSFSFLFLNLWWKVFFKILLKLPRSTLYFWNFEFLNFDLTR
jgi:hypothetical protein